MTKTILSLCLAAAGFVGLLPAPATAHEAPVPAATQTAALSLPATVRINQAVVIETHRRHRYHRGYHRGYYGGHRRHYYYRHGHRYYR